MMKLLNKITKDIYDIGTDKQKAVIDSLRETNSSAETAKLLGYSSCSTVRKYITQLLKKAAKRGIAPYAGMTKEVAEGFTTKRVSTFYNEAGEVSRQWHIQEPEKVKQLELLRELSSSLLSDLKPLSTTPISENYTATSDDLMVNIPIGDAHIGMLAWGEECGEDYDLELAESIHKNAVDMLISQTPNASHCTIIDLGDYIHSDNLEGTTSRSGHSLDVDGRYHKVIRVAIRVVLYYIKQALKKFNKVAYRAEMGNHNDIGSIWMQELLSVLFKDEPRVTIGNKAGNVFYWQHGQCYFMSHHGHQIKGDRLYQLFAKQIMDNNIQTKYRKIYLGHVHHKSANENAICEIETYRTLAAKDAYSAGAGYHAGRSITAEVWHKDYGEVSTVNVTIPMLEDN